MTDEHDGQTYPVTWNREEGLFVWQGVMIGNEAMHRIDDLGIKDDHLVIYESGGFWTKTFEHPEREHMLRFDPNYPFPTYCYCLMCGKRNLHPGSRA